MFNVVSKPKKRLFLLLILCSFFLAGILIYSVWVVSLPGLSDISRFLPLVAGFLLAGLFLVLAGGILCVMAIVLGVSTLGIFQKFAWSAINRLFPFVILIGRVFGVDKEEIERSFIEVNNYLTRKKLLHVKPEKLLVLTPHCIQLDSCPHKVTLNALNCRRCGGCQIGELLDITQSYGANFSIVTGGTLARKVVKDLRPQAVLAIACERDLTSGIQEVFPMTVVGILNERPCGPCCNTRVDISAVKREIENFCGK